LKVFPIIGSHLFDVTPCREMQFGPFREFAVDRDIPPSPRSIGITLLGKNRELISCNQSLAGKIMKTRQL
jgi:hypothetical protein